MKVMGTKRMYQRLKEHPYAIYVLTLALGVAMVWGSQSSRVQRPCLVLEASVLPKDLRFLTQEDLLLLIEQHARRPLIGYPTHRVSLHDISVGIAKNPYIRQIDIYRKHSGNISATVYQKEPIARLSPPKQADVYLTKQGELLPLSMRFTARTSVLRLPEEVKVSTKWDSVGDPKHNLFRFLKLVDADPFWRAQITSMDLNPSYGLRLYTQLSKQEVIFGKPEDVENKLEKLHVLYTHILPQKGWGRYRRVDLRFENLIVCK